MVRYLKEFTNIGGSSSSSTNTSSQKSVLDIIKQNRFQVDDNATDEEGLAIAPNGMVAVEYNVNGIVIRPDNDLELDSQELAKFKSDLTASEKLASSINNLKK